VKPDDPARGRPPHHVDVAVVGAGQAGLAAAYYLRRAGLAPQTGYVVLDANPTPGGAWQHLWPSLRLFSPAEYSSLPGWLMPTPASAGFPPAEHVVDYLTRYEQRYQLPVHHGTRVSQVCRADADPQGRLLLHTTNGCGHRVPARRRRRARAVRGGQRATPCPRRRSRTRCSND
jgi:putative flavoprotein involved in K+ transport